MNVGDKDNAPSCECKGFERFGYCRHLTHTRKLLEEGKVAPAARKAVCEHRDVFRHDDGELCCADCGATL